MKLEALFDNKPTGRFKSYHIAKFFFLHLSWKNITASVSACM